MTSEEIVRQRDKADREKRLVALSSVLAAVVLTTMKIVVGLMTNSLGILSEAAHSGLDLVAAIVTFYAVRASGRPADREHTYGHGKIENLSALFETFLLLVTCIWIIYEAIQRLFFKQVEVDPSIWAFLAVLVSVVLDYSRSRALSRVARKYDSRALEADALHFSTDIWSSLVVAFGLILVVIAHQTGVAWLVHADAAAALGVAAIVISISIQLGRKTVADLLDAVPSALRSQVMTAAMVSGVLEVKQARVRRAGPEVFADLTLNVDRRTSLEKAHDIATEAEAAIKELHPGADVVVHIDPVPVGREGICATVRFLAERHGVAVHGIRIHDVEGRHFLDMHIEADDVLTVEEAHGRVSAMESALVVALPWLEGVVSHIEPAGDNTMRQPAAPSDTERVVSALRLIAEGTSTRFEPHDVIVRRVGERLAVSFHCEVDPHAPLPEAHDLTEDLEQRLRARVPGLGRVVIHVEPRGHHALPPPETEWQLRFPNLRHTFQGGEQDAVEPAD